MNSTISFSAYLPVSASRIPVCLQSQRPSPTPSGQQRLQQATSYRPKSANHTATLKRIRVNPTLSASSSSPQPSSHYNPAKSVPTSATAVQEQDDRSRGLTLSQAISSRMLKHITPIAIRNLHTITASDVDRILKLLVDARYWRSIIQLFQAIFDHPTLPRQLPPRLYNDLFLASLRVSSRGASQQAYSFYQRLDTEDLTSHLRPKAFNFLFVCLCKALMVDEAKIVHGQCQEKGFYLNRYSYNSFLNACAKTGRVEDAFISLRAMAESKISPDVVSCNVLIACCVRADEIDVALSLLHRMPSWGISPDIYSYNSVINGFRKAHMLEEAFDLVAAMEIAAGIDPIEGRTPSKTIAAVRPSKNQIQNSLESDSRHGSNGVPQQFKGNGTADETPETNNNYNSKSGENRQEQHSENGDENDASESVGPDLVTYNTLISGIAATQQPNLDRALAVQKHMSKQGMKGNEVTYNALMATATRSGQVDAAFRIYDEMLNLKMKTQNVELFTTLITLCGQAGKMERAFKVHEEMISSGIKPSVVTFNALLTACQRGDRSDAVSIAMGVLKVMRETPGCVPDVITYSTIIDTLGRAGDFEQMRSILEIMKEEKLTPNFVTYTSMISALCNFGQLDEALQLMTEMEELGIKPNVYTFSCLISGARHRREMPRALQIVDMMKQRGVALNNVTYAVLLQLSARTGQRRWVTRVLQEMENDERLQQSGKMDVIRKLVENDSLVDMHSRKADKILKQVISLISSLLGVRKTPTNKLQ